MITTLIVIQTADEDMLTPLDPHLFSIAKDPKSRSRLAAHLTQNIGQSVIWLVAIFTPSVETETELTVVG